MAGSPWDGKDAETAAALGIAAAAGPAPRSVGEAAAGVDAAMLHRRMPGTRRQRWTTTPRSLTWSNTDAISRAHPASGGQCGLA
jgi:hypothetical protein